MSTLATYSDIHFSVDKKEGKFLVHYVKSVNIDDCDDYNISLILTIDDYGELYSFSSVSSDFSQRPKVRVSMNKSDSKFDKASLLLLDLLERIKPDGQLLQQLSTFMDSMIKVK